MNVLTVDFFLNQKILNTRYELFRTLTKFHAPVLGVRMIQSMHLKSFCPVIDR